MKKLFIGKLSFSTTEAGLRALFADYEPLMSVKIINDKLTGRSRGFGFIEIEDSDRASDAIKSLNGATLDGESITVNEARPNTEGPRGSGSGRKNNFSDSRRSGGGRSGYSGGKQRY